MRITYIVEWTSPTSLNRRKEEDREDKRREEKKRGEKKRKEEEMKKGRK